MSKPTNPLACSRTAALVLVISLHIAFKSAAAAALLFFNVSVIPPGVSCFYYLTIPSNLLNVNSVRLSPLAYSCSNTISLDSHNILIVLKADPLLNSFINIEDFVYVTRLVAINYAIYM